MSEGEVKEKKTPGKYTRREAIKKGLIAAAGIAAGLELVACKIKSAPEYGTSVDDPIKYYTVRIEHGEEEEGHIRKDPHMQGDKIGEIPTDRDLIINNVTKVWGSETGAAHGITTFPDGQSRGWWFKISWPSKENPEQKIPGYVSSQFVTIIESYDKPIK